MAATDIPKASDVIQNPYAEILNRNPYDMFTFGTDQRARALQAEMARGEYAADIAMLDYQNMYDRMYNNPTAKAERLKSAGINPDLAGLEGDPTLTSADAKSQGLAGNLAKDMNPLEMINVIGSVANQALQMYGDFQKIRGTTLDNQIKEATNLQQYQNLGFQQIHNELPYLANVASGSTGDLRSQHFRPIFRVPKRYQKQLNAIWSNYIDSDDFQRMVNNNRLENARAFSDDSQGFEEVISTLKGLQADYMKYMISSAYEQTKGEYQYNRTFDNQLSADAQNSANSLSISSKYIKDETNKTLNGLMGSMEKSSNPVVRDYLRPLVGMLIMYFQNGGFPTISTQPNKYGTSFKLGF